jgi:hypothetical protein
LIVRAKRRWVVSVRNTLVFLFAEPVLDRIEKEAQGDYTLASEVNTAHYYFNFLGGAYAEVDRCGLYRIVHGWSQFAGFG